MQERVDKQKSILHLKDLGSYWTVAEGAGEGSDVDEVCHLFFSPPLQLGLFIKASHLHAFNAGEGDVGT